MDRLIYTAMTGANAATSRQSILSNNLANAQTTGFKAEISTYRAVPLNGEGASTRVFAIEASSGYLNTPGPAQRTDRKLDALPSGSAWFAVQGLDGTEAYTRHGHFEVSSDGTLVNSRGLPVLSNGGAPITVPANAEIAIGHDGGINAKVGNQPSSIIGRLKLSTPTAEDPIKRSEDGMFRTTSGEPLPNDDTAEVQVGALEGSNVNSIEAMVGIIQTARQFEAQMRMLQTAESNDRSAGQLLSLQG